jgi:mannose-6-phosphate isomerase-like protein (cupin superfamily)
MRLADAHEFIANAQSCATLSSMPATWVAFRSMVAEARLEQTEHGIVPKGEGWYVLNMRDAEWRQADGRGAVCVVGDDFEGWRREADQLGINPFVLGPGEPMAMYHREADQEGFLVVSGEAVLIVQGEERHLRAWDFVHCPPNTKHVIVGGGSGPCLVIAIGARAHDGEPDSLGFPADDVAKRRGASVEADTMDGGVAYASVPGREPTAYRDGWLPG